MMRLHSISSSSAAPHLRLGHLALLFALGACEKPADDAGVAFTPPVRDTATVVAAVVDSSSVPVAAPDTVAAPVNTRPVVDAPIAPVVQPRSFPSSPPGAATKRETVRPSPVAADPIRTAAPEPSIVTPPAPPVQYSEVLFQSNPAGALVRLKARDGRVVSEGTTPAALRVPADEYSWDVNLEGYLGDQSGPLGLQLFARRSDTVAITLTRADDRRAILTRANTAFARRGGCAEAVRLYESIPRPNEMGGDLGTQWTESRMRLGQCYKEMREYDRALRAFEVVVGSRPGQWSAKFESGVTSCAAQDFETGLVSFRDMGGAFLGRVDATRKRAVQLLARYGTALCRVQQLERLGDTERNRDLRETSLGSLDEFITGAETYLAGEPPPEMKAPLEQALTDARAKRDNLFRT
jgi:hypothetical protein